METKKFFFNMIIAYLKAKYSHLKGNPNTKEKVKTYTNKEFKTLFTPICKHVVN